MSRPPLDGLRIVSVSQFGAGPFGTQLLADMGAEVIKIEDPGVGGDVSRYVGPYAGEKIDRAEFDSMLTRFSEISKLDEQGQPAGEWRTRLDGLLA